MDPLSILGAAAAASQLAQQGGNIIKLAYELYSGIQGVPESTRRHLIQIQQLIDLSRSVISTDESAVQTLRRASRARLIIQNESLQKESMVSILGSCLRRAVEFHDILKDAGTGRFSKIQNAVTTVMKEKKVIGLLASLEREKSCLSLCIAEIDSSLLHSINVDVKHLATFLPNISAKVNDLQTIIPGMRDDVGTLLKLTMEQEAAPIPNVPQWNLYDCYIIPNRRVRDFVGREAILAKIGRAFARHSRRGPPVIVLQGLGGQGKTQIALEYCHRAKAEQVRAIFWIDSSSENTVRKGFEAIAEKAKGADETLPDNTAAKVDLVLDKLSGWTGSWLMVFDDYNDLKTFDNIQDFVPEGETGRILITSRNPVVSCLADEGDAIEVPGLEEDAALDLFWKQSRAKQTSSGFLEAKSIVKRLVYHPLAITQAGSYIRDRKIALHDFICHYNQRQEAILKHTPQLSQYRRSLNNDEKETSLNVFTTWELSFQQLIATASSGINKADLLTLFAFFNNNDISEQLFRVYSRLAPNRLTYVWPVSSLSCCLVGHQWDSEAFVETLNDLSQLSLVQSWFRGEDDSCHLSLHPLVKDWIRLRTDSEIRCSSSLIALNIIKAVLIDCYHQETFILPLSTKQTILSHLDVYKENREFMENSLPPLESFNEVMYEAEGWFAAFLTDCGRYEESEEMNRHILLLKERSSALEDRQMLMSINNLADSYFNRGKFELAEALHRKVLRSRQQSLGADHPETLKSLSLLAWLLLKMGNYVEAEEMGRNALKGREMVLGAEHQDSLSSLCTLAEALRLQSKYGEAEVMHRRALKGREDVLGSDHPRTLASLNNLGLVLQDQGKFDVAEQMSRQAAEGRERVLGAEHPETLKSISNLGLVLQGQGRLQEAEDMTRRALTGKEKALGEEHPSTLNTLSNLALIFQEQGKSDGAEKMARRAVKGQQKILGQEHHSTLISVWNLALILSDKSSYYEASKLYEQAITGLEKVLGPDHPDALTCWKEYTEMMDEVEGFSDWTDIEQFDSDSSD